MERHDGGLVGCARFGVLSAGLWLALAGCAEAPGGALDRDSFSSTAGSPVFALPGTGGAAGFAGSGGFGGQPVGGTGGGFANAGIGGTGGSVATAGTGGSVATGGTGGSVATGGTGGVVATGGTGGIVATGGTGGEAAVPGNDPVLSAGCGKASTPGSGSNFSLDIDGTNRTYIVAQPSGYDANHPYRLIFAWHYLNGSASGIASGGYYGMEARSAGSAILVSPEGINAGWANTGGRDVAFATALMAWMKQNYCVDETRIFSVGFSYGAIMSNTAGCALGDQFRAIAPMAGSGPRSTCKGQVAAWLSHGTSDTTVSFSSGQASRDHWVAANHCTDQTTAMGDCVAYQGCDEGYPVHWCEFSGGHTRPSFAPDAIWAFFEQF